MCATASGGVPAKTSSFSPPRAPHGFLGSLLERHVQGLCLTRSCLIAFLNGSNGLMTGNWHDFQDPKHLFLIVSDGPACVFLHTLACSRTLRRVCSPASLFQTVQATPPKRDPSLLVVSCLSPKTLTSENTYNPAAPESSFAPHHFTNGCPTSSFTISLPCSSLPVSMLATIG